ncbi:hypothetical protein GVO57_09360 [Sphingomonas changnyeongensis]|uniref:Uncharacterized protein n=1 Tax=Sphingomonas changnyeongensis TaxID=2698679 RepID=A0A7Z2S9Q0_9SPHN|nr:hypothetical protein [Sphingomonas changnyeongensis]QHL90989.1 hypothetical protein GVO57_09360 [Sphingomonas changnyeongensis]
MDAIEVLNNADRSIVRLSPEGGEVAAVGDVLSVGDTGQGANISALDAERAVTEGKARIVGSGDDLKPRPGRRRRALDPTG